MGGTRAEPGAEAAATDKLRLITDKLDALSACVDEFH